MFQITKFLKSLVQGEEINKMLFQALEATHFALRENIYDEEYLQAIECITAVKILDALGYGRDPLDWRIRVSAEIDEELLKQVISNKEYIIALINKSIEESHL